MKRSVKGKCDKNKWEEDGVERGEREDTNEDALLIERVHSTQMKMSSVPFLLFRRQMCETETGANPDSTSLTFSGLFWVSHLLSLSNGLLKQASIHQRRGRKGNIQAGNQMKDYREK